MEAKSKFAKLFIQLNKFLDAAKIQEFVWEKLEYEDTETTPPTKVALDFDEKTYLILVLRYKELFAPVIATMILKIKFRLTLIHI